MGCLPSIVTVYLYVCLVTYYICYRVSSVLIPAILTATRSRWRPMPANVSKL